MTTGSLPSMTATTEFVVPRSIPMILFDLPAMSYRSFDRVAALTAAPHCLTIEVRQDV
jgi:hypothetical protein